jgi:acyl-CoA reductase-like NAD-dependent aldehyde dehydrogenase
MAETLAFEAVTSAAGVKKAAVAAAEAQKAWGALSVRERARRIMPMSARIAEKADAIAKAICADVGKTSVDAMAAEVFPAAIGLSYYAKRGRRVLKPRRAGGGCVLTFNKVSVVQRVPFGVVGIVSPWNYPFAIPFAEICMAFLAGNAVLLKVASNCPRTAEALDDCVSAADIPRGLYARIAMPGREAGDALLAAGIGKLFFTGSVETGKELMGKAAATLTPVVLELGGCDAAIVRADADLERAAWGILWAGYANAGQSCGGAQRILVHESVYGAFSERLVSLVKALRFGEPGLADADIGPLISEKQRGILAAQVRAAMDGGAKVLYARDKPEGWEGAYHPALVLEEPRGAKRPSAAWTEEFFGPVTVLKSFSTDDEAVEAANASDFGLTASVWSRNRAEARSLAARLEAGAVMINDHLMSHGLAETPWGGFKDSGIGRSHGAEGLLEMTQPRVVVDEILTIARKGIWWHPYSEKVYEGHRGALALLCAKGFGPKLKGLGALLKIVGRYFEK